MLNTPLNRVVPSVEDHMQHRPPGSHGLLNLFAASYVSERLAGGTGYQTSMRKSRSLVKKNL